MVAAPQLETLIVELCSRGTSGITLDLSGITFIDSKGLRAVLLARELTAKHGSEFSLIPGPPHVQRIFELTKLLDVLPFQPYGDRESHKATKHS
jgi:anti-anti-sigma factor